MKKTNKKNQAHALIFDSKGRFLLQQRDDKEEAPKIKNPGTWGLFGGSIDGDETPLSCLRRELVEEINLDYRHLREIEQIRKLPLSIYLAKFMGSKKLCQHEGQGMGWFTKEQICRINLALDDQLLFINFFHDYKWKSGKYLKILRK